MAASSVLQHNQRIPQDLKEGDLVEFTKSTFCIPVYSHWAVYIGNEEIVHLTGNKGGSRPSGIDISHSSNYSNKMDKAHVVRENLLRYAGDRKIRKNNDKDRRSVPLPGWQIVQRAMEWIGRRGYHLRKWNCEHFATLMRYGNGWSDQADTPLEYGVSGGAGAVVGGLVAGGLQLVSMKVATAGCVVPIMGLGVCVGLCICFTVRWYRSRNSKKNN